MPGQREEDDDRVEPIAWENLRDLIKKPVQMGLQDEVIRTPHPIRAPRIRDERPIMNDDKFRKDSPGIRNDDATVKNDSTGISNDGVTVRNDSPGIRNDDVTIRNDSPGIRNDGATVKNDRPGIRNEGATVKNDSTGISNNVDNVRNDSPGIRSDGAIVKNDSPGIRNDGATVKNDRPGIRNEAATVKNDSPGIRNDGSTVKNDNTGIRNDGATVKNDRPGIRNDGAVVKNDSPGIRNEGAKVKNDSPGIRNDGATVKNDSAGIRIDGATVKNDRTGISNNVDNVRNDSPGIKSDGAIVKNDSPGIRNDDAIVKNDSTGISNDDVTVKNDSPGIRNDGATVKNDSTGIRNDGAIVKNDSPGMRNEGATVRNDTPGIRNDGAIVKNDSPGMRNDGATVKNYRPGISNEGATVKNDSPGIRNDGAPNRNVTAGIRDEQIINEIPKSRDDNSRIKDDVQKVQEDKAPPVDHKSQTRIPVSRFKPAVERVQRERKDSRDANDQKSKREAPPKPRRSSIPKLNNRLPVAQKNATANDANAVKTENEPVKDETPVKTNERRPITRDRIPVKRRDHYKIVKKADSEKKPENEDNRKDPIDDETLVKISQVESVQTDLNEKLDDEFDKLYEEIVDNDAASLPDEILEKKVKDPEKLESKFEEIVHQYDDETIEQVNIEPVDKARYSKIPLLRRRSSHDVKVPKQSVRRLSIKTGNTQEQANINDEETHDSKVTTEDEIKPNSFKDDVKLEPSEDFDDEIEREHFVEVNNNEDPDMAIRSPNPPIYNTIPTPDAELVKVGIFGITTRDIPLGNDVNTNRNIATPELETVKVAIIDTPLNKPSTDNTPHQAETIEAQKPNEIKGDPIYVKEVHANILKPTPENYPEVTRDVSNKIPAEDNSVVIQNQIDNSKEETIKVVTIISDTIIHNDRDLEEQQKNVPIRNADNELKSVILLKKTNEIEERTKSRYINKPLDKRPDNTNIATLHNEEDIPTVDGKVSRILKRLTSQEPNFSNNNNFDKKEEVAFASNEAEEFPKKKSILSKIAMFERAESDPEPPSPKNQPHIYTKPKRTISEEIRHSPKIVQEVLKPDTCTGQTDKHKIVTVDIIKPVEVITDYEEQVVVVENLKEEAIVFENLDNRDDNLNKAELIENEPVKHIIMDRIETVLLDNTKLDDTSIGPDTTEEPAIQGLKFANNVETKVPEDTNLNDNRLSENHDKHDQPKPRDHNLEAKDKISSPKFKPKYSILKDDKNVERLPNAEVNRNRHYKEDKIEKWKSSDALSEYVPVKDKIKRLKSHEDTNMKRAKSTAELDIGEAVKGKVKKMIVRMNSFEVLDDVKQKDATEIINVKERPRKRSVSEKIALFESKLTPVKMDNATLDMTRALNVDEKPVRTHINAIPTDANVTHVANVTRVPNVANVTRVYNVANETRVPNATHVSNIANVTHVPNAANVTRVPNVANVTRVPNVANVTRVPNVANVTNVTNVTNVANVANVTNVSNMPNVANVTSMDLAAKIEELTNAKLAYKSVTNMSFIELNDGRKMPVVALGTALLDPRLAKHIVAAAIDLGFRAIDTAFIYGNEKEVGEGIRAKIQDGTVKREDLFIMSKLWSTFHRPDLVEPACRASLAATGLDYFDLYMIHNPMSFKEGGDPIPKIANVIQFSSFDYLDAWFAMEALLPKGIVKSIGVSNFNSSQITRILDKGRVTPVVNQVECHPFLTQERLSDFCEQHNVRLSCYGVLGSKGTPADFKSTQTAAIDEAMIKVMSAGLGMTAAQLLIRFQIDSGHGVVVKASSPAHLWEDLRAVHCPPLQPGQVSALQTMNRNKRAFTFTGMGETHKHYPFRNPY